jgi:hypothetical protein
MTSDFRSLNTKQLYQRGSGFVKKIVHIIRIPLSPMNKAYLVIPAHELIYGAGSEFRTQQAARSVRAEQPVWTASLLCAIVPERNSEPQERRARKPRKEPSSEYLFHYHSCESRG